VQKFSILLIIVAGCTTKLDINEKSYALGGVGAFSELVNAGVKTLALSTPLPPNEMDAFIDEAKEVARKNSCEIYRESDLIITDLFPEDVAEGMDVLLIYQGQTLDAYLTLKNDIQKLIETDKYKGNARVEISRRFGRMLSYSPKKINSLLANNTDFRTMDNFGVEASNVFLYYNDLAKATKFYTEVIGLEMVADYKMAVILRVSKDAFIILVDADEGMHSATEPKTVALSFITDDLPQWYAYLKEQKVPFRTKYEPGNGKPHDGFVAIDPEGYLLEFEIFNQHKENEDFIPKIKLASQIDTSNGLGIRGLITWVYHKDIAGMQQFYENVLGLEMLIDQGWTKVYQVSTSGFIGLVDEKHGMHSFTENKGVTLSFWLQDLDGWFEYVNNNNSFKLRSLKVEEGPEGKYRAFVGYGPEGYFLEFDRFYKHDDNDRLLDLIKTAF